jgi:membrane protein implicated in regulation of membrane protease activity
MSTDHESESSRYSWVMLLVSLPAAVLGVSLLTSAGAWWEFATAATACVLAVALVVAGLRGVVARIRRQRLDRAEAEAAQSR